MEKYTVGFEDTPDGGHWFVASEEELIAVMGDDPRSQANAEWIAALLNANSQGTLQ